MPSINFPGTACLAGGLYSVWGIDYNMVIECLSSLTTVISVVIMYLNAIVNINKVKDVLLFIKHSSNYYMNRPENIIMRCYGMQGRRIIICYGIFVYTSLLCYLGLPGMALLINAIIPSNRSQGKHYLYIASYGVDKEKYFYYVSLHMYTGSIATAHLICVCYATYMFYGRHASALFAVVSYQLKTLHVLNVDKLINVEDTRLLEEYGNVRLLPRDEQKLYKKLLDCIKGHSNAIKYTDLYESLFTKCLLMQLLFSSMCLTATGVEVVKTLDSIRDALRFGLYTVTVCVHIFLLCLPGENILSHSEQVHTAACQVMWYALPKKCHGLYKFVLLRTLTTSKIIAFKMVSMSMETFLKIIQSAMSYFTVLLSIT